VPCLLGLFIGPEEEQDEAPAGRHEPADHGPRVELARGSRTGRPPWAPTGHGRPATADRLARTTTGRPGRNGPNRGPSSPSTRLMSRKGTTRRTRTSSDAALPGRTAPGVLGLRR
jgi:hypothetical protein